MVVVERMWGRHEKLATIGVLMTQPRAVNDRTERARQCLQDPVMALEMVDALHLASASLPVGGFAYSQGLEQAHASGLVQNRVQAAQWIRDALLLVQARQDLPLWLACHDAATQRQWEILEQHARALVALRESAEFRLESQQMGYSLMQLYPQWLSAEQMPCHRLLEILARNYTAAHATLAALRAMPWPVGLTAYVWSWLESQVMSAVKILPLGQRDGQWLFHEARSWVAQAVQGARDVDVNTAGTAAFGLALLSTRHETQYSRLFRS